MSLQVAAFIGEDLIVAGGFDGEMFMLGCKQQHWQLLKTLQGMAPCFAHFEAACPLCGTEA